MATITAPIEGYSGSGTYGPLNITFTAGSASVPNEDLTPAHVDYFRSRGYAVDGWEEGAAPDPLKGNADAVLEHARGLGPDELQALIEQEEAGKARKGLLDDLRKLAEGGDLL